MQKVKDKKANEADMLAVMREAGDIQQRQVWFINHRKLYDYIQKCMIEREMEDIIEIEQNIMSAVDPERTEPIPAEMILKEVQ